MYAFMFACVTFLVFNLPLFSQGQQLANYLGTGSSPRLQLPLFSQNGPNWNSFTIDYQGIGNIPYSSDPSTNWSPWNVVDTDGNYYGTITLNSDGQSASWNKYEPGQTGYYLEGINFTKNNSTNIYQLTVDTIHIGVSSGPFPNTPPSQPATYAGTTKPIVYSVAGTQIIDNNGQPVIFKGFVRPSLEWNPQGQFLSPEDIATMATWNGNIVRLDLNQLYWFSSGLVTESGSYKQIIDAIIYYATLQNMAVILDLHWVEQGHQNPMANRDSLSFWTEVATAYKNYGTVLFELFNEPESIDKNIWLQGNDSYAGYQELYNAVRSTGANNLCIINGLDYGYDLSFVNDSFHVEGFNIVYGSHPYNEKGATDWKGAGGSLQNNFSGILNKYPIIFTEFGVNEASYFPNGYQNVYLRNLDFARQNKISYCAFAWWVEPNPSSANVFPCIISDWKGTPLNGGLQIYQDMQHK